MWLEDGIGGLSLDCLMHEGPKGPVGLRSSYSGYSKLVIGTTLVRALGVFLLFSCLRMQLGLALTA